MTLPLLSLNKEMETKQNNAKQTTTKTTKNDLILPSTVSPDVPASFAVCSVFLSTKVAQGPQCAPVL